MGSVAKESVTSNGYGEDMQRILECLGYEDIIFKVDDVPGKGWT